MSTLPTYKLVQNVPDKLNKALAEAGLNGWKPILMTTAVTQGNVVRVFVILERLPA